MQISFYERIIWVLLKTNWFCEKPLLFIKEYFAKIAQAAAVSKSHWVSLMILFTVKSGTALCVSLRVLLQGLLAVAMQILT